MSKAIGENFIKNIRYFMYENSLTLTGLAKLSGINKSTLTKIIKENRLPSRTVLAKISAAIGVSEDTLIRSLNEEKVSTKIMKIPLHSISGEVIGEINSVNQNADAKSCIAVATGKKFNLSPIIPEKGLLTAKIIHPLSVENNDIILIKEDGFYELYIVEINSGKVKLLDGELTEKRSFHSKKGLCNFKIVAKIINIEAVF